MRSWPHTFSLPACASGSSIWPRAVIGHTEPRSLCFACRGLQYLIKNAQAVGLINLWDSNVRPKISAPLLPQWLHSHPNSHCTTLRTCSKKCYFMIFMWYVYPSLPFMCVCVCFSSHTPVKYFDTAQRLWLYVCLRCFLLHSECYSNCLAWTHFTGFSSYSCGFFRLGQLWFSK